jgi:hypothetical protein
MDRLCLVLFVVGSGQDSIGDAEIVVYVYVVCMLSKILECFILDSVAVTGRCLSPYCAYSTCVRLLSMYVIDLGALNNKDVL